MILRCVLTFKHVSYRTDYTLYIDLPNDKMHLFVHGQLYDTLEDYMDYEVNWERHGAMCVTEACLHFLDVYQYNEDLADVSN